MIYRTCLLLMLSLGLAQARSAPYTDWAFDAQRAKKNKDLDALGALVVKKPEFARIFFYGQIYSLVTPGIPDKEKSRLRVRLERIAAVLAEQSPPDFRPQLLLDRVDSGQLVEEARASRDLQEQLILAARAGAQLPARVAAVEHIEIAEGVFYNILFRAEIARRRLGGRDERALLLHLAHHVAEGFVLAHGDLRTWETLKSWHSGRVPLEGMPFLSERLAQAFTAKLKGDLPLSLKMMNEALQAAQRSRGGSIFTALVMNGTAFIAGWMNKHEEERRIHLQVLQAVRPLGKPSLIALLSGQMVRSHLADKSLDELIPYARELRALGPPATRVGIHLTIMEQAALGLRQLAAQRIRENRLMDCARLLKEAEAFTSILVKDEAIAVRSPLKRRPEVKAQFNRARASELKLRARLAERRGQFQRSLKALEEAQALYKILNDTEEVARCRLERAQNALALGRPAETISLSSQVWRELPKEHSKLIAKAYQAQGQAHLIEGKWSSAFAAANEGLRWLLKSDKIKKEPLIRARLHALAAAALEAAGHPQEAQERASKAQKLKPDHLEFAAPLALLLSKASRSASAEAVLSRFQAGEEGRMVRVLRGCLQVRGQRYAEALETLDEVRSLMLPHFQPWRTVGRSCYAYALIAQGQLKRATGVLEDARSWLQQHPDPRLTWRIQSLLGRLYARRGKRKAAVQAWQRAIEGYLMAGRGRSERGETLNLQLFALPDSLEDLPQMPKFFEAAARYSKDEQLHLWGISLSLWQRALSLAPTRLEQQFPAEAPFRTSLMRIKSLHELLADAVIRGKDRERIQAQLSEVQASLGPIPRKLESGQPSQMDALLPFPLSFERIKPSVGNARLFYRVEGQESLLWLLLPKGEIYSWRLPGRAKLEALLKPARAALLQAPKAWNRKARRPKDPNLEAWKALKAPTATLLPFTRDEALMERLKKLRLQIFLEGPLLRFPLGTLILELPDRRIPGIAPQFLASQLRLSYGLSLQRRGVLSQGSRSRAIFGPLQAATGGCPKGPACDGEDQETEAKQLALHLGEKLLSGSKTSPADFALLRTDSELLYLLSPLDAAEGTPLLSPSSPDEAYIALDPWQLSQGNTVKSWIFSRLSAPSPRDTQGLGQLFRAIYLGGGQELLLLALRTAPDAYFAGEWARHLANDLGIGAALELTQRDLMRRKIDIKAGGAILHHPFYWGGWMFFGVLEPKAPSKPVVIVKEPPGKKPVAEEPPAKEPPAKEPPVKEPPAKEPPVKEPPAKEPLAKDPIAEKPPSEESPTQEPVEQKPAAEEPVDKKPEVEGPPIKEPITKEPPAQESPTKELIAEEPVDKKPEVEESPTKELIAEEPVDKKPEVEGPPIKEPVTKKLPTEESRAGEPPTKKPAAKEPAVEKPSAEEPEKASDDNATNADEIKVEEEQN